MSNLNAKCLRSTCKYRSSKLNWPKCKPIATNGKLVGKQNHQHAPHNNFLWPPSSNINRRSLKQKTKIENLEQANAKLTKVMRDNQYVAGKAYFDVRAPSFCPGKYLSSSFFFFFFFFFFVICLCDCFLHEITFSNNVLFSMISIS